MRIGVIGPQGFDTFADNIADALRGMGHQASMLGHMTVSASSRTVARIGELAFSRLPELEDRFSQRLVRAAAGSECEAIINVQGDLPPDTVKGLRRLRIPVALWFPDAVSNLGRARMLAAPYTALFFKDPMLVERLYNTLDVPVWYLPEACNPRVHRPVSEAGTERHIVLVGNTYPSRLLLLQRLHQNGIPLALYGGPTARWARGLLPAGQRVRPEVFGEEKSRVFRAAAGVLNNLHPAEMNSVNCRLFEATAAGGAVLCERRSILPDLYDEDREIVPFTTFSELMQRAQELLADPSLTESIGDAASKRAHAEHTYEHRLNTVLEKLS